MPQVTIVVWQRGRTKNRERVTFIVRNTRKKKEGGKELGCTLGRSSAAPVWQIEWVPINPCRNKVMDGRIRESRRTG